MRQPQFRVRELSCSCRLAVGQWFNGRTVSREESGIGSIPVWSTKTEGAVRRHGAGGALGAASESGDGAPPLYFWLSRVARPLAPCEKIWARGRPVLAQLGR